MDAQNQGQSFQGRHGVVTLRHVEAYLTSASGVLSQKQREQPPPEFSGKVYSNASCPTERTIQIAHRSDDTMRIQLVVVLDGRSTRRGTRFTTMSCSSGISASMTNNSFGAAAGAEDVVNEAWSRLNQQKLSDKKHRPCSEGGLLVLQQERNP